MSNIVISLENPLFAGLGRRKYSEKYTPVPLTVYPEEATNAFTVLYELLGATLSEENSPLVVVSAETGYPQRLIGPRVFRIPADVSSTAKETLAIVIGRENFPIDLKVDDDGLITFKVGKKNATLEAIGKSPFLKLPLGNKNFLMIPFFVASSEDDQAQRTYEEFQTALVAEDLSVVGVQKVGGANYFSALKNLLPGRYKVKYSTFKDGGSYGMKAVFKLEVPDFLINEPVLCSVKSPEGLWSQEPVIMQEGYSLSVDSNKKLYGALMGDCIQPSDNVVLEIISSEVIDGKTFVKAELDWNQSASLDFDDQPPSPKVENCAVPF